MDENTARKDNIDILKAICAFMVVTIHCPSLFLPSYIESIVRTAVPVFFIISGYFYTKNDLKNTFYKIAKTIGLLLVTELGYACMYTIGGQANRVNEAIDNGIINIFLGHFLLWLPGWFLLSLAYMYFLGWIFGRLKIPDIFIIVLMMISLFLIIYAQNRSDLTGMWKHVMILRGLPFFFGGVYIRRFESGLKRVPTHVYGVLTFLSILAVIIHKYIMLHHGTGGALYLYAGTVPMAFFLFCYMLFIKPLNAPFLKYTGRHLSMYIYCIHVAVMCVLGRLKLEYESLWLCVLSVAAAFIAHFLISGIAHNTH